MVVPAAATSKLGSNAVKPNFGFENTHLCNAECLLLEPPGGLTRPEAQVLRVNNDLHSKSSNNSDWQSQQERGVLKQPRL
jgi:hypothetical protein